MHHVYHHEMIQVFVRQVIQRFVEPALPIATVATGTPPGIWAMDNNESKPFNAFD